MTLLLIYTVAAFGIAIILGQAKISHAPRVWIEKRGAVGHWAVLLVECPTCLGFWTGLAACAYLWDSATFPAWLLPFYTSGANYLLGRLSGLISNESDYD